MATSWDGSHGLQELSGRPGVDSGAGPSSPSNAWRFTGRSDSRSGCEATDELVARDSPAGTGEDDATPVQHQHEISEVEGEL